MNPQIFLNMSVKGGFHSSCPERALLAVIVVYIVVNVLEYLFGKSAADAMTKKIQHIKEKEQNA